MRNSKRVLFIAAGFSAASLALGPAAGTAAWASSATAGRSGSAHANGPANASHSSGVAGKGTGNSSHGSAASGNGSGAANGSPGSDQPPGNNGTVKIDEFSMDPGMDNDPHVPCDFSVSFYGYDGGLRNATLYVTPVAPTSGTGVFQRSTSWNVGTRTGGDQFDANVPVSASDIAPALAGVTPQPQQGYHLRLEVEVTGSQGSDDKYKVFWLAPCAPIVSGGTPPPTTTPPTTLPTTPPTTAPTAPVIPTTVPATVAAASHSVGTAAPDSPVSLPAGALMGDSLSGSVPVVDSGQSAGGLAFTGADIAGLSIAGLGLLGVGALLTLRSRRSKRPAGARG